MNERYMELDKQASDYYWSLDDSERKAEAYTKKFAELIVKKFDDILVLEYLDCVGNRDKQAEERIERLRERVKTYFGVEE